MDNDAKRKRQLLIDKLLAHGYETDPRGNFIVFATQMLNGVPVRRKYRYKFQDISVRVEVQGLERHPVFRTFPWYRMTSCYYSQIVDCGDGRLRVGTMFVGKPQGAHELVAG